MGNWIEKKVLDCYNEELDFIVPTIKELTYYVVDIKYKKNNLTHRCIMATGFGSDKDKGRPMYCELYSSNYDCTQKDVKIKDIYYFKIISEIKDMKRNIG